MTIGTSLAGKIAVVTGGGKGIGRAIVAALADAGADVAIVGRETGPLEEAVQAVEGKGRRGKAYSLDLREVSEIRKLIPRVTADFGDVDILVNNAGVQLLDKAEEVTEEDFDATIDVNLKAPFFCSQEAAKHWIGTGRGGKIVNITSIFADVGFPMFSAYCASKGGVLMLTRTLAAEWAARGVNVNAIGPTGTITEMNRAFFEDPVSRASFLQKVPAGRLGETEDIVGAAVFLAGPGSDFVHGQLLFVDGGYTVI